MMAPTEECPLRGHKSLESLACSEESPVRAGSLPFECRTHPGTGHITSTVSYCHCAEPCCAPKAQRSSRRRAVTRLPRPGLSFLSPTRGRAAARAHQAPGSPPRCGQRGRAPAAEAEAARQRGPSCPPAAALRRRAPRASADPRTGAAPRKLVGNGDSGAHPAARPWRCAGAAAAVPALAGSANLALHGAASRCARPRRPD
ncbi:unnamed protein product [Coccothraustes coccothraustes]